MEYRGHELDEHELKAIRSLQAAHERGWWCAYQSLYGRYWSLTRVGRHLDVCLSMTRLSRLLDKLGCKRGPHGNLDINSLGESLDAFPDEPSLAPIHRKDECGGVLRG